MKKGKQLFCNVCGKQLEMERGILKEGVFEANQEWGYFSEKDLEIHQFHICEHCYDKMVASFVLPVTIKKKTECL